MGSRKEPRELAALNRAARALAEATEPEEVVAIRDAAEAARMCAKRARQGLEVQNRAAEIRLRAERKLGEMLAELPLRGGDRTSKSKGPSVDLDDLGINKHQSARWQVEAKLPEEVFAAYVERARQVGGELTGAGLVRLAKRYETDNGNGNSSPRGRR